MTAEIKNLVRVGDKIEKKKTQISQKVEQDTETIGNRKNFFKRNQPTSK